MVKYKFDDDNIEDIELGETDIVLDDVSSAPKPRYVAVKGVNLDKFPKVKFGVGDEIPLKYLEDPDVDFDNLLRKGAIKEIGS